MSELADFLLARIAEDEDAARAATPGPWAAVEGDTPGDWPIEGGPPEHDYLCVSPDDGVRGGHSEADAHHIVRHDPARVLAECEAKRRIVELRATAAYHADQFASAPPGDPFRVVYTTTLSTYDAVLRSLAIPFAAHPDYRDEWRP